MNSPVSVKVLFLWAVFRPSLNEKKTDSWKTNV